MRMRTDMHEIYRAIASASITANRSGSVEGCLDVHQLLWFLIKEQRESDADIQTAEDIINVGIFVFPLFLFINVIH